ncbi:hypothetical protein BFL38_09390 [Brachyspira hampsonii]|uniref:Uncharacterized protein n=1 Tax=Brachyspira hampsonii TaxID=1287055 RepID=A0A1E5NHN4_9SPIR|nr:hypothetical protein [Brachyspira hampsonii]OEJ15675.1 hypothetical protein BFL38_09390 [Brachyspira hampsonii]
MIKFLFLFFTIYINAFSVMADDIYKLSDLKYKGYDIHREKSDIIGFHKDEYNYNLFLEDDNFDTNNLYIQTLDKDADIKLKITSKQNQKYNINILEINIMKLGRILNTYKINIYPALFNNIEITDGYNNYKSIKENKSSIIQIPKNIYDSINERNIKSFLKIDFFLNGSKEIKNFKEINNYKTFDIELFSRYPYYFNVYNIKISYE